MGRYVSLSYAVIRTSIDKDVLTYSGHSCCIDKSSSAELTEAINSMYQWYKDAAYCYAHLSDFDSGKPWNKSELKKCRWFKRGWTLQELLAPKHLRFFASDWQPLFTRADKSDLISEITRIPKEVLDLSVGPDSFSIAQRFSWAADRETSRPEDTAYCLMGLFGINMPLLYGEGQKAFYRLQEQIMRESDDQSIFAWVHEKDPNLKLFGLLAPKPSYFYTSNNIVPVQEWNKSVPYSMTNSGLSIAAQLIRRIDKGDYLFILKCYHVLKPDRTICIEVKEIVDDGDQFARHGRSIWYYSRQQTRAMEVRNIFIRQAVVQPRLHELVKLGDQISFHLTVKSRVETYEVTEVFPKERWTSDSSIISAPQKKAGLLGSRNSRSSNPAAGQTNDAYYERNNWTWHSAVRVESNPRHEAPGFIVLLGFNGRKQFLLG